MAKQCKTHSLKPLVFFFLLISLSIFSSSSSARARLLHEHHSLSQNLAASEPALNLALPSDKLIDSSPSEKDSEHVIPCEMDSSNVKVEARLAGKYGPRILNMLLKGPVSYSGPSKGTNDVNN
ncbi:hypothetical protein P3X46_025855 [Hevea brasiliensis]|uniref:Uncharacterized protein n=1 Tax=Hevea brasiliensis TaxID=3981 RepID=A0ABQ9L6Z7_HEVBR|nr:hypothetical protein P3X46_025855 [Hevea brasiliensis]